MHEISLAGGILRLVEDAARREGFRRVAVLRLSCGRLAGVEPQALRFALEVTQAGTVLAGARLEIDEPPGRGWCPHCEAAVALAERGAPCPCCGGTPVPAIGGDRLEVVELLVDDGDPSTRSTG